ncbi:MAG: ATP-binding protein [Oscillospiraceae bacterium]|nr:ATP-binding protein [Oscillospiraceae bacterium]
MDVYGLRNVNKIADKYNGIMITDYKNHIFTVDVLLYLDD